MTQASLNMSRRIRRTPFTDKVEEHGVSGFTVVNHTLLPKAFNKTIEEDYWHLRKHVQIWDVGCQRQVEISGYDAHNLVQWMTPRDLCRTSVGKCYYIPLITENGGLINDPVLLKIAQDRYWLSIADSDVLLWVKGLAIGSRLNVKIKEPNIWPLAIQGPKACSLMIDVFGEKIKNLKFFNFDWFEFEGTKQLIARSGYSKQGGYEIYLKGSKHGSKLWDLIWKTGRRYNIRPGSPNLIERIEGGLLSYGNEMTIKNNPLECGMEKYCSFADELNYIGKEALKLKMRNGLKKKICGIIFGGSPMSACTRPWIVTSRKGGQVIGKVTSGIYSPYMDANIGLSMIKKEYWDQDTRVLVHIGDGQTRQGKVSALPFSDNL